MGSSRCIDARKRGEVHEDLKHVRRLAFALSEIERKSIKIVKTGKQYFPYDITKEKKDGEETVEIILYKEGYR